MTRHNTGEAGVDHGLDMMDRIYGPGVADLVAPAKDKPYIRETIEGLFGHVWDRPHLSIRDRRLLVLGATAMLGRADLVETQVYGALVSGDLDEQQLDEAVLQLAYYCGWGNAAAVSGGIEKAKARYKQGA